MIELQVEQRRVYKVYRSSNRNNTIVCRTPESLKDAIDHFRGEPIVVEEILSTTLDNPMEKNHA